MEKLDKKEDKSLDRLRTDRERSRGIRLAVSDMDGSFLNRERKVSRAGVEAVRKLQKAGILFAVCTGRNYEDALRPLKEAGITCAVVAMNGAAVYAGEGKLLQRHVLSREQAGRILEVLKPWKDRLIIQLITTEEVFVMAREELFRHFFTTRILPEADRSREEEEALLGAYYRITAEEFLEKDRDCCKIEILSEDTELIRRIREPLGQVEHITVAASFPTNWEITHEAASKDQGLKSYAAVLGYGPEQIMAVGDGDNDRTMLSLPLGWSVAMGNGTEVVRKTAQVITGTNEEDGFAMAVEALLEGRRE